MSCSSFEASSSLQVTLWNKALDFVFNIVQLAHCFFNTVKFVQLFEDYFLANFLQGLLLWISSSSKFCSEGSV